MKYWVFDLDGTLVDSFPAYRQALEEIFTKEGLPFGDEQLLESLSMSAYEVLLRYLPEEKAKAHAHWLRARSKEDALGIRAFDGILECLQALKKRGLRAAVWTGRDLESASVIIESAGLSALVETCVSGTCVAKNKPHDEGLRRLMERFGCEPEELVMVGDHDHDMMAAREVGARAVRASWNGGLTADVPCERAQERFRTVEAFSDWLKLAP